MRTLGRMTPKAAKAKHKGGEDCWDGHRGSHSRDRSLGRGSEDVQRATEQRLMQPSRWNLRQSLRLSPGGWCMAQHRLLHHYRSAVAAVVGISCFQKSMIPLRLPSLPQSGQSFHSPFQAGLSAPFPPTTPSFFFPQHLRRPSY